MRKILLLLLFVKFQTHAQEIEITQDHKVVSVELFRGIVKVSTAHVDRIQITHQVYDYDSYDQQKRLIPYTGRSISSNKLEVDQTKDSVFIKNNISRELHELELIIPNQMQLKVMVKHYGELKINDVGQPLELEIFNGTITVNNSSNSISATVIRAGDIRLQSNASNSHVLALSTYDGNIQLRMNENDANYLIKTDLGEIVNEIQLELSVDREVEFLLNGEPKKAFWYRGRRGDGAGPSILITNTFGKIYLSEF